MSHPWSKGLDLDILPKIVGSDSEMGNFVTGMAGTAGKTDYLASRVLLHEIPGIPGQQGFADSLGRYNVQDWGRKHLSTLGGVAYIDLQHLELCTPECRSSRDHLAAWVAMLRVAQAAQRAANQLLGGDKRVIVLANNSDGAGNSYGAHLNVLLSRRAWDDMFRKRMYPSLFFLMAHQVSSIVYTGQGKVGSENGRPQVDFQISQRADFIETLVGEQTTHTRPLVNSRNEPLCGSAYSASSDSAARRCARLHVIFYDANLNQVATWLKVGVLQIVCAMIEARAVPRHLCLEDPLRALHEWSHDPGLTRRARLASGRTLTATDLQREICTAAGRFVASGRCEGVVPEAEQILAEWDTTLTMLERKDFESLARRTDWVQKHQLIEGQLDSHPELDWRSPQLRHLDFLYSSLDPGEGLFWALEADGIPQQVVTPQEIEQMGREPPADTRAWTRAMLLRLAGSSGITRVDWDTVSMKIPDGRQHRVVTVKLDDPCRFTRAETEAAFASTTLGELADRLDAHPTHTDDGGNRAQSYAYSSMTNEDDYS